jgi:D-amino-acid oxidase
VLTVDRNTRPDDNITRTILDRCKCIAPELLDERGEFEVLQVLVGLRPRRNGGPRLEIDRAFSLSNADGAPVLLCHSYGHHSAGFEGSVGAARATVILLLNALEQRY